MPRKVFKRASSLSRSRSSISFWYFESPATLVFSASSSSLEKTEKNRCDDRLIETQVFLKDAAFPVLVVVMLERRFSLVFGEENRPARMVLCDIVLSIVFAVSEGL